MKTLKVNGSQTTCQADNLASLLLELEYQNAAVATAVNGDFVAKTLREDALLNDGDNVEILAPMQGG